MKRLATTAAAAILIAGPAFALIDFEAVDIDGDEFISLPEALAAYPDMDPTDFDELDTSDDRLLDYSEANSGTAAAMFAGFERAEAMSDGSGFDMSRYDADADSMVTYDEVNAQLPGVPRVYFQDFDLNNDGKLDSNEVQSGAFQNLLNKYGS